MDQDLDRLFKESKPAALPQAEIKSLPTLEELNQPEPVEEGPRKQSRREKAKAEAEPEDRLRRTLFVGNLPLEVCKSKALQRALKKKLSAYGKLVSIRFRSVGFSKAMPRKLAFATKQFHEERDSVNAYIVMEREEDAREAVKENASVFEGHHIRVDVAAAERKNDTKKSIFIGNLPLNINEEAIWNFFGTCGQISNVRIIRDKKTNLGKGFGYVTFSDKGSLDLALQLAGTDCAGRPIRVSKCQKEGFHKETKLFKEKREEAKLKAAEGVQDGKTVAGKSAKAFSAPRKSDGKPAAKTDRSFKPAPRKFDAKKSGSAKLARPVSKPSAPVRIAKPEAPKKADIKKPFKISKPTERQYATSSTKPARRNNK